MVLVELTVNSALIRWPPQHNSPGIRMFQVQYNSSTDDTLVYRMIPSTSQDFLVRDLMSGREYDLCVLAVYDDSLSSLTATRQVGCVQFVTETEYSQCQSLHSQFLGGTMIIIIGGIIVASVLVFIIILMIRYKVYSAQGGGLGKGGGGMGAMRGAQANGGQPAAGQVPRSGSKATDSSQEEQTSSSTSAAGFSAGGSSGAALAAGVGLGSPIAGGNMKDSVALVVDLDKSARVEMSAGEDLLSPSKRRHSRTCIELKGQPPLSGKDVKSTEPTEHSVPLASEEKKMQRDFKI